MFPVALFPVLGACAWLSCPAPDNVPAVNPASIPAPVFVLTFGVGEEGVAGVFGAVILGTVDLGVDVLVAVNDVELGRLDTHPPFLGS
jgi:hypothetical protein